MGNDDWGRVVKLERQQGWRGSLLFWLTQFSSLLKQKWSCQACGLDGLLWTALLHHQLKVMSTCCVYQPDVLLKTRTKGQLRQQGCRGEKSHEGVASHDKRVGGVGDLAGELLGFSTNTNWFGSVQFYLAWSQGALFH